MELIESSRRFQLETQDGKVLAGNINMRIRDSHIEINDGSVSSLVSQNEVVAIRKFEHSIISRVDMNVDYGFSYGKANENIQSNLSAGASYKTVDMTLSNRSNFIFSSQSEVDDTKRMEIDNYYSRFLGSGKWFYLGLANFLSNSEQDLELRTMLGGGVGRQFIKSNTTLLNTALGAVYARETYTPESFQSSSNNLEGFFGVDYENFHFDATNIGANFRMNPSFSDLGRIRIDFNTNASFNFLGDDLYWKFTFYTNYDSRPPLDTSKVDYGLSTSIGWSIF